MIDMNVYPCKNCNHEDIHSSEWGCTYQKVIECSCIKDER